MYDLLLFDLDGTLCDPLVGTSRCINHALETHGFEPIAPSAVGEHIGPPLNRAFEVILGTTSVPQIDALIHSYRERYSDIGYTECTLYPGVSDAVRELFESGIPLAICTSKRRDFAERILNMFELTAYFDFVDGGEIRISKSEQIARLRRDGRVTNRSIMIGDRGVDLVAAHTNSLLSAGVLWGYGSQAELEAERPRHLFRKPSEWQMLAENFRAEGARSESGVAEASERTQA